MPLYSDPFISTGEAVFTGRTRLEGNTSLPAASITDANIAAASDIATSKLKHRHSVNYISADGIDVATSTRQIHLVRGAGVINSVRVRPTTVPTGDFTLTIDVKKAANGSGSFTTLLSSTLVINASSVNNTLQIASLIATPSVAAGDVIQLIVTAAGASGAQGQGLFVNIQIDESGI